jgi:hypothetical protein
MGMADTNLRVVRPEIQLLPIVGTVLTVRNDGEDSAGGAEPIGWTADQLVHGDRVEVTVHVSCGVEVESYTLWAPAAGIAGALSPGSVVSAELEPILLDGESCWLARSLAPATAHSLADHSRTSTLLLADQLARDVDENHYRLGACLSAILGNSWWEGSETFGTFVAHRYGFRERKARYLIEIFEHLRARGIAWDQVRALGWTKLKELVRFLTRNNVDVWVAKAASITVVELQRVLRDTARVSTGNLVPAE